MKYYYLNIRCVFSCMLLLGVTSLCAQKINSDSLLVSIIADMKNSKNHQKTIEKCLLGKKIAPEYLDFQLQLGRNYEFIQRTDSARYYYKMILDKNPKYEEAFLYLINLDITEKKYDEALATAQKAIFIYPKSILYYQKEAEIYNLLGLKENEIACLKKILLAFPNDTKTVEQLNQIIQENKNSRIGINYNYTFINRDKIGPWHLVHLEYINDQKWGSLIGRLSYAERFAFATVFKGIQYEVESYYRINKKIYTYWDATYSNDLVFPKLKFGGSLYVNLKKGWETDLGIRLIKAQTLDIVTLATGVSKYSGSYWWSLSAYLNNVKKNYNPVFILNTRYYLNSKYDYFTANLGFGTSPDERATIALLQNRLSLNSIRIGGGFYKIFQNKIITGVQLNYNYQEYFPEKYQNEYQMSLVVHYKI